MFTARNRQNPFAKRRRAQREAEAANEQTAPVAVPVDLNPDSDEYTQAPDISTYAAGDIVDHEMTKPEFIAIPAISTETQAKIDAVVNHAIPPVADERPDYPGLRGAETMRKPADEQAPPEPESDAKRGRGRPRPQETIDRDNAVHALLVGADAETGISKESIAAELGEKEQQVYSSLRQLTKEGRAESRYVKPHGYRWFAA